MKTTFKRHIKAAADMDYSHKLDSDTAEYYRTFSAEYYDNRYSTLPLHNPEQIKSNRQSYYAMSNEPLLVKPLGQALLPLDSFVETSSRNGVEDALIELIDRTKTITNTTKKRSYVQTKPTAPSTRERVLAYITSNTGVSRNEIAFDTELAINSVCGRVNELLKSEDIVVSGEKYDSKTKRNVQILSLNEGKK